MSTQELIFAVTTKPAIFQRTVNEELSEIEVEQIKDQVKDEIRKQYQIPDHLELVISDCQNVEDNYTEDGFID